MKRKHSYLASSLYIGNSTNLALADIHWTSSAIVNDRDQRLPFTILQWLIIIRLGLIIMYHKLFEFMNKLSDAVADKINYSSNWLAALSKDGCYRVSNIQHCVWALNFLLAFLCCFGNMGTYCSLPFFCWVLFHVSLGKLQLLHIGQKILNCNKFIKCAMEHAVMSHPPQHIRPTAQHSTNPLAPQPLALPGTYRSAKRRGME